MKQIEFEEYRKLYDENKEALALHSCWTEQTGWMTAWGFKDDESDMEPFLKSKYSMPMDKRWAKDCHSDEALAVYAEERNNPANWEYWKRDKAKGVKG